MSTKAEEKKKKGFYLLVGGPVFDRWGKTVPSEVR